MPAWSYREGNEMNIKQIRALIEMMEASSLTVLEVSEGENRLLLKREPRVAEAQGAPLSYAKPSAPTSPEAPLLEPAPSGVDFNRVVEVKAPMVGVFYSSPAPDAPPYVQVGSRVKPGDVLCVIEAMKLLNEIVAETSGEIVDVCVQNAQVVEFSQTLFKIC